MNVKKCVTCLEVVNVKDYEEHMQAHNNKHTANTNTFGVQIKCDYCNMFFTQNEYDEHIKVCECKNVECKYCKMKIDFDLLITHEDHCGARTIKCAKCKMYVVTKDYEEHIKKGKCRRQQQHHNENVNVRDSEHLNVHHYRVGGANEERNEQYKERLIEKDKRDERAKKLQQRYEKEEVRNERVKRKEDKRFDIEKEMEIMQLKRDLMATNNNHNYYHRDYNNDYYKKRLHYHSRDDNRRSIYDSNKHPYNHHNEHNHYNNYDIKDNYQLHYNYNQISSKEYKHQHNGDYLDDLYKNYTKSKEKATHNNNADTNKYVEHNIEDDDDIVNITHNMKQILQSNPKQTANVNHNKPISLATTSQFKDNDIINNNNNHLELYFDYKKRHTRPVKASINHANSLTHTNTNNNSHNHHNNSYHYQQIPEKDTSRLALEIEHLNKIIHKDSRRGTTQPNKVRPVQDHEQPKAICLYKRKAKDPPSEYKLRNQVFPFKNDVHLNSLTESHYNYYKTKHHSSSNNNN